MEIPSEDEILRYRLTGENFRVKKITPQFIILFSIDGSTQIMTGKRSLIDFFEKIPRVGNPGVVLSQTL